MAHLHRPIHSNGASQTINDTPIQPIASTSAPKKVYKKKFRAAEDEEISKNTALRYTHRFIVTPRLPIIYIGLQIRVIDRIGPALSSLP